MKYLTRGFVPRGRRRALNGLGSFGIAKRTFLGASAGGIVAPTGYAFLTDEDGVYLTDADGYYLLEAI